MTLQKLNKMVHKSSLSSIQIIVDWKMIHCAFKSTYTLLYLLADVVLIVFILLHDTNEKG
jgi:hypothetical protein